MTLRCKANQLAWIVKAHVPSNVGLVVTTVRIHDGATQFHGEPVWEVTFSGVVVNSTGGVFLGKGCCPDASLRPITHPGLTEEVTTDELIGVEA